MTIQPEIRKWYENDLLLVVLFIVFFPIAIYGLLKRAMESQSQARGIPSPSTSDRKGQTSDPGSDFGDDFLSISRDGFVMKDHVSPNGRFIVGSLDHHNENDRRIKGKCALFESGSNRPLFVKTIDRANNAHVTDEGMVIVENWGDDKPSSSLLAFDKNGNGLWTKHSRPGFRRIRPGCSCVRPIAIMNPILVRPSIWKRAPVSRFGRQTSGTKSISTKTGYAP